MTYSKFKIQNIILTLALLLTCPSLTSAAGGDVVWQYGDTPQTGKQEAASMAVDSAGNTIIAGYSGQTGDDDYYTIKIKADGTGLLWSATYDKSGGNDYATAVTVDSNDDVIVSGYAWNGSNYDFHTIKYNSADGAVLWQHNFNGAANGNDYATAITIDGLDNIYIGGNSQDGSGKDDFMVLKYGTNGITPLWQKSYNGSANGHDRIKAITSGSNGIAVTGESQNATPDFDAVTIKYGFDSSLIWEKRKTVSGNDKGIAVRMDTSANVIMTATTFNGLNKDIYVVKYNSSTGTEMWQDTYNGGGDDEPADLYVDASGDVFVTGYAYSATSGYDIYTKKYNGAAGTSAWSEAYNSSNGNSDKGVCLYGDDSGSLFVVGNTYDDAAGNYNYQTLKYAKAGGNRLWQESYDGSSGKDDRVVAVGVTASGEPVTAGWSDMWTSGSSDYDYYAIKYDPGMLNPPTGLNVSAVSASQINLSWTDNSSNEDGFKIERKTGDAGIWSEIASVGSNVTTYNNTGLTADNKYYYRVKSYNAGNGDSYYSDEAYAVTTIVSFTAPATTYVYNSPDNADDYIKGIACGPDYAPVATGYSYSTAGQFDYLTVKLHKDTLAQTWMARYDSDQNDLDIGKTVVVDGNNDVAVSGYSYLFSIQSGGNTNDIYTIKYPSTGPPESWNDQYNGPAGDDDRSSVVDVSTDGSNNYVVVGYGRNANWNDDIYVIKYLSNGTRAWAATPYDGGVMGHDYPSGVAFDPSGNIIVAGYTSNGTDYDYFVRKYNGATGAPIWTDIYNIAGTGNAYTSSLAIDASGNVYVTGDAVTASGNEDFYTIKYNGTSGARIWERSFNGLGNGTDEAISVKVDPVNGDVVVAGRQLVDAGNNDFHIIRYDTDGNVVWQRTLDRPSDDDIVMAMAMDKSGNVYVAGNTDSGSYTNALVAQYDYNGSFLRGTEYAGAAGRNDVASAVAVNSLGKAYVGGYSTNAGGNADYLVFIVDNELQAPRPFQASPSFTTVNLTWTDNTATEDGFFIERKTGLCSSGNPWAAIYTAAANATFYNDTLLNTGAEYCYRITSFKNPDDFSRWIEASATTLVPAAPGGLSASAINSTRINLSWTDNTSGETGFKIERCAGAGCSDFSETGTAGANVTSYADMSACNSTNYSYRIIGYKSGEWSTAAGNIASAATATPSAPTVLSATRISEVQINLSWTDNSSDETGFKIERCSGAGCSDFAEIATVGSNVTTYNNTGLTYSTDYTYRVRAYKTATCGWDTGYTNQASASTTIVAPSGLTTATVSTTQINLLWTDNTGNETGFKIERCEGTGCSGFAQIGTVGANVTSYADTSVCENTTYRYRVRAYKDAVWDSGYSNEDQRATNAKSAPTVFSATRISEVQINLSWTDNSSDETGVKIERCSGAGCSDFAEIATVGSNVTTYNNTGLTYSTDYTYRVRAYKTASCGWDTVYSNEASATTTLAGPTGLNSTTVSTTRIDLTWTDNTSDETGFKIERCSGTGCSSFVQINTVGANVLTYADTAVCENTTYRYRVRAYKTSVWDSSYSNESERATNAKAAPTALTATRISEVQINLSWADNTSDETGFKIERCQGAGCIDLSEIAAVGANVTTYNNTGLTAGVTYNYLVKAYKTATCGWNINSNTSTAETTILAPADFTVTVINTTQVDLSWTDTTVSETGFKIERCEGADCSDFVQIHTAIADVVAYSDESICENTTYKYRIKAYKDAAWDSPYSIEETAATDAKAAPSGLAAMPVSEFQIDLAWTDNTYDETGYELQRCTGAAASCTEDIDYTYTADVSSSTDAVAYWAFNEGNGTAVHDLTGSSSGTITGAVWTTGNSGNALNFNGSGDFISSTLNTDQSGAKAYTFEAWVYPASISAGAHHVISTENGGNDWALLREAGTWHVFTGSSSWSTGKAVDINVWQHLVVVYEPGTGISFYKDGGTPVTTTTINYDSSDNNVTIGRNPSGSEYFDGKIDEVAIYDRALTDSEVQARYANGAPLTHAYSDADLAPGTTYTYRIKGYKNSTCNWDTFTASVDTTTLAPPAPTDLTVTAVNTTRIDLLWTDNTVTESGFRIERCAGPGCSAFTEIATVGVDVSSYSDTTACENTTYRYRVRAYKAGEWNSGYTNEDEAPTNAKSAPTVFSATRISEVQINLAWTDNSNDETGFKIERCTGGGCSDFTEIGTVGANVTSYSNTGITSGVTFNYRVKAYKTTACAWEIESNTSSADTTIIAPSGLNTTTVNTTQINLTWTDNTASETGFEIERCQGAGCSGFAQIGTVGANVTSYSDTSVCESTTYRYRVRAYKDTTWDSGYSNESERATNAKQAPTVLSATRISEVQINLSWTDNANDETGFKIERCSGAGCSDFAEIATAGSNVTTYNNTGLTYSTDYRYRVRAYKTATCGWDTGYTNEAAATTTLIAPSGLNTTTVNTTQINLTWTDNTASETGSKIERCQGAGCSGFAQIGTVGANVTSYSDTSVCESTTYRYRVRAYKDTTWDSGYSNESERATNAKQAPTVLSATRISEVQINLSWTDNANDETGFKIERCSGAGCSDFAQLTTVGSNVTTYNNTGLTYSSDYTYRVRAYKTATCGWDTAYSDQASASTSITAPGALNASTVNSTQINLSWTDNTASETGFKIERCAGTGCSDFTQITTTGANTTAYSDTSICNSTEYNFRVRAYKTGEWDSGYSGEDPASTSALSAPSILTALTASYTQINLLWADNMSEETGFKVERCAGPGCSDFTQIGTTGSSVASYSDTTISPSTTYCYRVRTYKTATCAWDSGYGNESCEASLPSTPTTLTATALNAFKIRLEWTDNAADEDGYKIEVKIWNGEYMQIKEVGADITTYTDTESIEPAKQYTYRIRAFRDTDSSPYSNEASATATVWQEGDGTCVP